MSTPTTPNRTMLVTMNYEVELSGVCVNENHVRWAYDKSSEQNLTRRVRKALRDIIGQYTYFNDDKPDSARITKGWAVMFDRVKHDHTEEFTFLFNDASGDDHQFVVRHLEAGNWDALDRNILAAVHFEVTIALATIAEVEGTEDV